MNENDAELKPETYSDTINGESGTYPHISEEKITFFTTDRVQLKIVETDKEVNVYVHKRIDTKHIFKPGGYILGHNALTFPLVD